MNIIKSFLQFCGLIILGLIFSVIIPFTICFSIANILGFSGLLFGLLGIVMGLYVFSEATANLRRDEQGLWIVDHCSRIKYLNK